jgi:hypothetical protein
MERRPARSAPVPIDVQENVTRPPAPIRFDSEQLEKALRPVLVAILQASDQVARIATAMEEANRQRGRTARR